MHPFRVNRFKRVKRSLLAFLRIANGVEHVFQHFKSDAVELLFAFDGFSSFVQFSWKVKLVKQLVLSVFFLE